jgi:hypothetical protein
VKNFFEQELTTIGSDVDDAALTLFYTLKYLSFDFLPACPAGRLLTFVRKVRKDSVGDSFGDFS